MLNNHFPRYIHKTDFFKGFTILIIIYCCYEFPETWDRKLDNLFEQTQSLRYIITENICFSYVLVNNFSKRS